MARQIRASHPAHVLMHAGNLVSLLIQSNRRQVSDYSCILQLCSNFDSEAYRSQCLTIQRHRRLVRPLFMGA